MDELLKVFNKLKIKIKDFNMNILILGGGGREHTFCWKLSKSKVVENIFIAPGNAGTAGLLSLIHI